MADDPLGNLKLPYDYSQGDPDAPKPATTSAAPAPPAPVSTAPAASSAPSHPDLDKIKLPYTPGDQSAPAATSSQPGMLTSWGRWAIGQNPDGSYSQIDLQPRSLSQVGTDVTNYGRVAGNQAFVPGSLDVGLAALQGDTVAQENAKTTQAESELDPMAAAIARFQGQRLSANRLLGEGGVPYANNPIAQGTVTGGFGTLLHGGSWSEALANAAADTGLSAAGEAIGTAGSAAAKKVFDRSSAALSNASTASLEHLQDLWNRRGNVADTAEQYADAASGDIKAAYQKIAGAAREPIETSAVQRAIAGGIGSFLPGGGVAAAYIADPTIKAYNQWSKGLDVTEAIHKAYEPIAGAVKSTVDPDAWRSAFQNLAVSQGPTGSATLNAVRNFSPSSWAKALWSQ
jgi:hypothetical protein